MARIPTRPDDPDKPRINPESVSAFFDERARRIATLGPVRAVIYQDKHPDLAERRDVAEKEKLLPLLALDGSARLLDLGCGTGRWVDAVADGCAAYHGVDASQGLVDHARQQHALRRHCRFTAISAPLLSLEAIGESLPFDRVLCAGLLIYLNDAELGQLLSAVARMTSSGARVLVREPVGVEQRLTIQDHYSDDLEQTYNAIYRTADELIAAFDEFLAPSGFVLADSGDVFDEDLNNRKETRQRWFLLVRNG